VFVQSERQAIVSCGSDGATESELTSVTRLAQIRQRAAQERRERAERELREAAPVASGARQSRWAAVVAVVVLVAAAAGVYLTGALVPHAAIASIDRDLRSLAEDGEVGAQFALGLLYDYGLQGSPRDPDEAYRWYLKAAAAGDIDAQYFLGNWHRTRSPRPDGAEAVYWITTAAEQGHRTAQVALGDLHLAGEGFAKDPEKAVTWYAQAADQGSVIAHCSLARLYAGAESGYRRDPPAAAMHDYVARVLGKECGLADFGASASLAKWTADEGTRRGKDLVAKGFARRPLK
jgi:TPR repeat protein